MAKYDDLAEKIIDKIGGRDNIEGLTHCSTKLRFRLKDDSRADTRALKTMNGVVTVLPDSVSYQVVIGYHVPEVYASVMRIAGLSPSKESKKKERVGEPIPEESIRGLLLCALGAIAAVCVLKGIYAGYLAVSGGPAQTDLNQFIGRMGNGLLYMLPVLAGYGAAVRLRWNRTAALTVSLVLAGQGYVAMQGYMGNIESTGYEGGGYVGAVTDILVFSLLPLLLSVWAAAGMDVWLKKYMSRRVRFVLIPFMAVLAGICLTWWGIRPVHGLLQEYLGSLGALAVEAALCALLLALMCIRRRETPVQDAGKAAVMATGSKKIQSPMSGRVIPLSEVQDAAFATGLLGDGRAIIPSDGRVYAPADGKVTGLFMDGHAISMLTEQGIQLLIHVGINTVELVGKGFSPKVVQNEIVNKGKLLLEFDLEGMRAAGYDLTSPVIVTNFDEYTEMNATGKEWVKPGEDLLWML